MWPNPFFVSKLKQNVYLGKRMRQSSQEEEEDLGKNIQKIALFL
jgi:hypothetical protein